MDDRERQRDRVCGTLELAHGALRAVDAADFTAPMTPQTLAMISQAVDAVERMAKELGYRLLEFRN